MRSIDSKHCASRRICPITNQGACKLIRTFSYKKKKKKKRLKSAVLCVKRRYDCSLFERPDWPGAFHVVTKGEGQ